MKAISSASGRAAAGLTSVRAGLLQRKCACGGTPGPTGECDECRRKRLSLQRKPKDGRLEKDRTAVPTIVHEVLRSPGQPLDTGTRRLTEERFGHDFSKVRVHTNSEAAASAQAVDALAYTVGRNIVFNSSAYSPNTEPGLKLLAHELTHVVQQSGSLPGTLIPEAVGPSSGPAEHEAETAASMVVRSKSANTPKAQPVLVARQAAPAVVPEAEMEPEFEIPYGEAANDNAEADPMMPGESGPRYAPNPNDHSLEAGIARAQIEAHTERVRMQQERPVATLSRGGKSPDFISEHGTRKYTWMGGIGGGGSITVRNRNFHVLDAIESDVSKVKSEDDLERVLSKYFPMTGIVNQAIDLNQSVHRFAQPGVTFLPFFADDPVYLQNFDPRAQTRLQTFEAAVRTRSQAVPALASSRLLPKSRRKGGCRIEPIEPLGDDPLSALYCHLATGSPFSYKITIESGTGALTQRWAEIDSLRGNTWYECKCGYEALITGESRGEKVAAAVLDKLDKQVLNHADISRTCGLEYRYIVSNHTVADILRERWHGNVVIDVVPFEGCN